MKKKKTKLKCGLALPLKVEPSPTPGGSPMILDANDCPLKGMAAGYEIVRRVNNFDALLEAALTISKSIRRLQDFDCLKGFVELQAAITAAQTFKCRLTTEPGEFAIVHKP